MSTQEKWRHTGKSSKNLIFFLLFLCCSTLSYPKISQEIHTAEQRRQLKHWQEKSQICYPKCRKVERDGSLEARRPVHAARVHSQELHIVCSGVTGQIPERRATLPAFGSPGDALDSSPPSWCLHWPVRLSVVNAVLPVPARSFQPVMTGWRCWRGSAEPTTPPGQWARSLHGNRLMLRLLSSNLLFVSICRYWSVNKICLSYFI